MGVLPTADSKMLYTEEANDFIAYLDSLQTQTLYAIISSKNLARLLYLAGGNTLIVKDAWGRFRDTVSLKEPNYQNLLNVARERVNSGLISQDWYRDFMTLVNESAS
ncbi:MAG: hypothetical protein WAZ40_02205 [Minisyncoccia bacterium]